MTGTVTISNEKHSDGITSFTLNWTSTSGGAAGFNTADDLTPPRRYSGNCCGIFVEQGSATPTDAYDMTIKNEDGFDLMDGNGADIASAADLQLSASDCGDTPLSGSPVILAITNAGDSKNGSVTVSIR